MANEVTIVRSWTEGGVAGKERVGMTVTVAAMTKGAAATPITAAMLGLTTVESCSNVYEFTTSGGLVYPAVVINDGSGIVIADAKGTAGNHANPADISAKAVYFEAHGVR